MTRSRKRKLARLRGKLLGMPLASAVLMGSGIAAAADAPAEAPEEGALQEVVVTAQKRAEDLQKVPISLQVLNTEKLDQMQVHDLDDYTKLLPSVTYRSNGPGQAELFFRGISTSSSATPLHAGFLPSSGLYLDEIPVTTVAGALDIHIYDIARVEALAGPQGTLYGASSLSGTLRIITNKPDPSAFSAGYDFKADKWLHGDPGGSVEGYVNIPLSENAAVRLVGYYDHEGGYINNVFRQDTFQRYSPSGTPVAGGPNGGPDGFPNYDPITINNADVVKKHWNDVSSYGGRAALKVDLNDSWTITPQLLAQNQKTHGDFAFDPHFGDLNVGDYFEGYNKDTWYQSELTIEGKISNWDMVYSGGYFTRTVDNLVDYSQYSVAYDAQAIANSYAYTRFIDANGQLLDRPVQYTKNRDKYTKMSHELRISSPQDYRLRATAGLFYQRQTDNIRAEFDAPNLPVYYEVAGQQDVYYLSQMVRVDRDYAVFGEASFDITNQLKLNAGIREFWVNNTLVGFFGFNDNGYSTHSGEALCFAEGNPLLTTPGVYTGGLLPCVNIDSKVVENGETHRVNLQYQVNPDLMVYGTYSTGFRPGGNNRLPTAGSYRSDTLSNFELGWKTSWMDRRLRWNGALFYEKWKNVQTAVQGQYGITSIVNAGDAKVEGMESELEWAATEHLTVSASGTGLLKLETTTVFCRPSILGVPQSTCTPDFVDAPPGTQLPVTPKVKLNGTARYAFNTGQYKTFAQVSASHQSSTTFSLESTSIYAGNTPSFTTVDFSAGTGLNNWHIEAYIQNAFDKRGELGKNSECNDLVAHYCLLNAHVYPIAPMQYGIKFGQKF
ncbi:MAG TPA: TonB-dependent receptor [Steroidobacteraceae bacterium]|nr:TonB-dependent receptor [Steroidobacteraceae bacterium]